MQNRDQSRRNENPLGRRLDPMVAAIDTFGRKLWERYRSPILIPPSTIPFQDPKLYGRPNPTGGEFVPEVPAWKRELERREPPGSRTLPYQDVRQKKLRGEWKPVHFSHVPFRRGGGEGGILAFFRGRPHGSRAHRPPTIEITSTALASCRTRSGRHRRVHRGRGGARGRRKRN